MKLVIVESPTKSRTISKFLGPQYKVLSSYGHVRDLPEDEFGLDVKNDFKPKYIIIPKAKKTVQLLKKEVERVDLVILSLDPDREGEAIAWHLAQVLQLGNFQVPNPKFQTNSKFQIQNSKPYQRIVFHEITKSAIEEALKNPQPINMDLVDAQQARRVLDRIVGYELSPFLWKKVARGLSAGRVQSVAVRLVVEREREIQNFVPQEYWTITAELKKTGDRPRQIFPRSDPGKIEATSQRSGLWQFEAILVKRNGKIIPKLGIKNKEEADKIVKDLKRAEYKIINIEKKEVKRHPLPPFTTSTLQQTAWQKFKWPAKLTMQVAQQLYEAGWSTYHRTDSLNISDLALGVAKKFITENYGQNYYQFRKFKAKGRVQEAHEAIRPTYPEKTPEKLKIQAKIDDRQFRLYDLIWRRFIACQMAPASFDSTSVEIEANPKPQIPNSKQIQNSKFKIPKYAFRATGQVLKFDGFLKVYPIKYEEGELPPLEINEVLELVKLIPSQHFTQPPPRYNEATLIKELEKNGIGRPSTYAPILTTIQERNYIEKDDQKKFRPTEIGIVVNDLLVNHFPEIVDVGFTAKMEEDLDKIASGEKKWVPVIKEFYQPFEENLQKKYREISKKDISEKPTEKICPKCGAQLLIRLGKFGRFYACSKFPKCKYTEPLEENTLGIECPKCKKGKIVEKRTKKNKIFYSCNQFPKCHFALWEKPLNQRCPKCHSLLVQTKRKKIKCSNKECEGVSSNS